MSGVYGSCGRVGIRLRKQIEDREFLLGHSFANSPLFLGGQRLRQLDESAEVLVAVDAALVVVRDQLLDPLNQLVAGRVAQRGADLLLPKQLREPIGLGALTTGEHQRCPSQGSR